MSQTIDTNLYDRQIRTYGIEAMEKINSSSVLIVGLAKGLGTEIAKNLALGGIKNILLFDNQPVHITDLQTGYYYKHTDIGKRRSDALAPMIQELNPYIVVTPVDCYKQGQNVTIVINMVKENIKEINDYTRSNNTKMVALWSHSLAGVFFTDANTNHTITDITGENIESVQIGSVSIDGLVTCAPNSSHNFQSGDTISFSNMEGTNLDIFTKEYMIKVINTTSFTLNDFVNSDFVFINGTANHIKKPVTISHESFEKQLADPSIVLSGAFDMEHSMDLINMFLHGKPCCKLETMEMYQFIPVVSIMGAFVASEAIKLITNKYMPASQWFTWSDITLIPKVEPSRDDDVKTDYGELWGAELETRLLESRWFLVGSGAIGCEHLKNMAFMGIHNVTVTDPDSIEKSNLNRQFLFRPGHIGKPKSTTAVEVIRKMKFGTEYTATLEKVGPDNVDFTNNMMTQVDGVINALDNIKARRFMDEQCFKFNLPLFESGTTGTKGNTQTVVPFLTETYSASNDPDTEKSFPLCTIKSFPNEIVHTIHWAIDIFEFFNRAPATMNRWITNPAYLEQLSQVERNQAIEDINILSTLRTREDRLNWAVESFVTNYRNNILQLLTTFPADHEVTPGVKFWSGGKRCPKPIMLDNNNTYCTDYIVTAFRLISNVCGIQDDTCNDMIKQHIMSYKVNDFTPKVANEVSMAILTLNAKPEDFTPIYVAQEFEKDDDSNYHIDMITAASNMRALNYGITPVSHQETKGIAGRIIPAIATTTAAVSGLVMLEMLKYLLNIKSIDMYRSNFINLASPHLVYSDPMPAKMIDIAGVKINEWTKFEYKKDTTLREFKVYYEDMFKTTISMIVIGTAMVYAEFLDQDVLNKNLSSIITEILGEGVHTNITISLASDDDTITIPDININL
jgi:ubiquitin-activating enzyme E1